MTVSNTNTKDSFAGTGDTSDLNTTFTFFLDTEIVVTRRDTNDDETVLVKGTHYTVSGGGGATGTINAISPAGTDVFAVGLDTWVVSRNTPLTQLLDFVENDNFPAESHEEGLDRLTLQNQDRQEEVDRALKYPITDAAALSSEIPDSTTRASKYLAFDANGEPIASAAPAGGVTVSTWIENNLLDDTSAAAVRTTIDAQEDVIAAEGDIVVGNSTPAAAVLSIGTSGHVLKSDGTNPSWVNPSTVSQAAGHIDGLSLTRDTADKITIGVGSARDSVDSITMAQSTNPFSKTMSGGTWSSGHNGSGLATSLTEAADTWYHVFLLSNNDGSLVDVGFDTDVAAANLTAGAGSEPEIDAFFGQVPKFRRIGSILNDSSSDITSFVQFGDWFFWKNPGVDFITSALAIGNQTQVISVPLGVRVLVTGDTWIHDPSEECLVMFRNTTVDNPSVNKRILDGSAALGLGDHIPNLVVQTISEGYPSRISVWTNADSTILFRAQEFATADNTELYWATQHWWDPRGRGGY